MSLYAKLNDGFRSVDDALCLTETEETWESIATAILQFQTILQEEATTQPGYFTDTLRKHALSINKCIKSERSRLSGAAMDMLSTAATELGRSFEVLLSLFLPTLLTLCGRPNKVFVTRARACLFNIIESTQSPQILTYLLRCSEDKSISLRLAVAEAALICLQSFNPPDIQRDSRAQEIETLIKFTATDANADIRKIGRDIFQSYSILLPTRVEQYVDQLSIRDLFSQSIQIRWSVNTYN